MPKWVYPLAFVLVLFLIFNDPSGTGDTAGSFASFIVDMLAAVGEFLTGLFEGASDGADSTGSGTPSSSVPIDTGSVTDAESFTHTHDGSTHTHSSS